LHQTHQAGVAITRECASAADTKLNTVARRKGVNRKAVAQGTNITASGCLRREAAMTSSNLKTALLWLAGVPLPIILLIALYLHPG
jgi:hypothetical protein